MIFNYSKNDLPSGGTPGQFITRTSTGMAWEDPYLAFESTIAASDWDTTTLSCTKTVTGIVASKPHFILPAPNSYLEASLASVYGEVTTDNSITFYCYSIPSVSITMNICQI